MGSGSGSCYRDRDREQSADADWPALQDNYTYLMSCDLIESCRSLNGEMSWDNGDLEHHLQKGDDATTTTVFPAGGGLTNRSVAAVGCQTDVAEVTIPGESSFTHSLVHLFALDHPPTRCPHSYRRAKADFILNWLPDDQSRDAFYISITQCRNRLSNNWNSVQTIWKDKKKPETYNNICICFWVFKVLLFSLKK